MCKAVEWVDLEWPDALKKCLAHLWEMYELERSGRFTGACDAAKKFTSCRYEIRSWNKKSRICIQN